MVNFSNIKSKIPPFLQNKYLLTILFFVVWITVFDKNSVIDWMQNKAKINKLKAERQMIQEELKAIKNTIEQLNSNDSLEKIAREVFDFHREDEDVFVMVE